VTKLDTKPVLREKDNDTEPTSSAGVMFTSLLLLIGGLLLTSAMLIHYGFKGTGENGESISGLTRVLEMAKSKPVENRAVEETHVSAPSPPPEVAPAATLDAAAKPSGFNFKDLFSKKRNGSVRWPRLKLSGFGLPAEGEVGFAIINGKHVVEGSTVNGATVQEILAHGVRLEYKGETKTLIVEVAN
jgi:hypothetical protein